MFFFALILNVVQIYKILFKYDTKTDEVFSTAVFPTQISQIITNCVGSQFNEFCIRTNSLALFCHADEGTISFFIVDEVYFQPLIKMIFIDFLNRSLIAIGTQIFYHKLHKLTQIALRINFTNFVDKHIPMRCFVMLTQEASLLQPLIKMIF